MSNEKLYMTVAEQRAAIELAGYACETSCFARRVPDLNDPNHLRQILVKPTF